MCSSWPGSKADLSRLPRRSRRSYWGGIFALLKCDPNQPSLEGKLHREPKERIKFLQERIREHELGGALLFYSCDVFYYTGTVQPSYLVVLPDHYFLFVRSGFEFASREVFIEKDRMKEERRLENIYRETFARLHHKRMGTELDVLTAKEFLEFRQVFSGFDFVNVSPLVLDQEKEKTPLKSKN